MLYKEKILKIYQKTIKWHKIECISYNSPERINFKKDSCLRCNKKANIRVYIDMFTVLALDILSSRLPPPN